MPRQRRDERHNAASHQWLAAGEAELAHAARDKGRAQAVELLEREHLGFRQKRHVFRHAIDAAEIAAVGHRDAQIGDRAAERVDQFRTSGAAFEFQAWQAKWHAIHAPSDNQANVPDKALIVQNVSQWRGARSARRYRVGGGGGKGEADVGGGGGNTLSCAGACSGAAIDGSVGPCIGLAAAGLGRATVLRGLGFTLRGGGAGGGSTWSVATTGLGTRSGGGLLNQEPSAWWTASWIVCGT